MKDLETKIKIVNDEINNREVVTFRKLYSFTTENICGYINTFDLKDKSLLTVGSSSDQVINAFYNGCNDITLIDINDYIKEYFYLKKAAIEKLSYKEFFKFMSMEGTICTNRKSFNLKVFNELIDSIEDDESKKFWMQLVKTHKAKDIKWMFTPDVPFTYELKKINNYLRNEATYNTLKSKIKNLKPHFINANIYDYELDKKYDNIFLSNIADYYEVDKTHKLYTKLKDNLNDNGSILIAYLYGTNRILQRSEIYNIDNTKKVFDDAYLISFKGREDIELRIKYDYIPDDVLVYRKK